MTSTLRAHICHVSHTIYQGFNNLATQTLEEHNPPIPSWVHISWWLKGKQSVLSLRASCWTHGLGGSDPYQGPLPNFQEPESYMSPTQNWGKARGKALSQMQVGLCLLP